jgi:cytochrome P450
LEIFGPNVVTLNGELWARHRRITTPPFNERNSSLVWKESLLQANSMLKSWVQKRGDGVQNTPNDTMALKLNVLMAAGFGKRFELSGGPEGAEMNSYRDALRIVVGNLFRAIMTSMLMGLPSLVMPRKLLEMKSAMKEVETFIVKMTEEERMGLEKRPKGDNLLSVLLRASERDVIGKGRIGLSDEKLVGNLFVYNVAGHDTTSNTLAYAITLLATNVHVQDWLREEIGSVFGGEKGIENWDYGSAFPQLKRCLAVMVSLIVIICSAS